MAFDWLDFLTFAKEIKDRTDDAAKRIAISRAYYCVYNKAKDYAERTWNYTQPYGQSSHLPMWRSFERRGATLKAIRDKGISLKDRRETADYELEFVRLDQSLSDAIKEADSLMTYLTQADK